MGKKEKAFDFDPKSFSFGKARRGVWMIVRPVLTYILVTFTLAVLIYVLTAMFFSTDNERRLRKETAEYERLYERIAPDVELLGDVVAGLQYRDDDIYESVFHASAPSVDPMSFIPSLEANDSTSYEDLVRYAADKSDNLVSVVGNVDAAFRRIARALSREDFVMPPMQMPVKGITFPQIGASVGNKFNPFYQAQVPHNGLDFIVLRGTPVYASADGVVQKKETSRNMGNTVTILHDGGYLTIYANLEEVGVKTGDRVKVGRRIGTVGMSGQSYAPHLHYEIHQGQNIVDPINYIFASVSPDEYANMLYMSVNTMQSMD